MRNWVLVTWPLKSSKISDLNRPILIVVMHGKCLVLQFIFFYSCSMFMSMSIEPSKIIVLNSWPLNGSKCELRIQFDHGKLNCKVKLQLEIHHEFRLIFCDTNSLSVQNFYLSQQSNGY